MADEKRVNWIAVMDDFARGASTAELARRHNVSERMIRKRKAQDDAAGRPWPRPEPGGRNAEPAAPGGAAPQEPAHPREGGSGPVPRIPHREALAAAKLDAEWDVTDEQLARALRNAAYMMLSAWSAGTVEPGMNQSEADVFSAVIAGAAKAIDKSRDVAGRKPGTPSTTTDETSDRPVRIVRKVVERPPNAVSA